MRARNWLLSSVVFGVACGALGVGCGSDDSGAGGAAGSAGSGTGGVGGSSGADAAAGSAGSTAGSAGVGGVAGSSGAAGAGGSAGSGPVWTKVDLLDDDANGVYHKDNSLVTGIWFKDLSNGAVALYGDNQAASGAVQHLSGPTTIDKIALVGHANGYNGQDTDFVQLHATSFGLIAAQPSPFGSTTFYSTDNGVTFTKVATGSDGPNAAQFWMSKDTAGVFHYIDSIGNVWKANGNPGPSTSWTRTWQPEAPTPIPNPLPAGACTASFHQGYFNTDAQQALWVSKNGQIMMYGRGYGDEPAGVCRSTDGGNSFFPVEFPTPPAGAEMATPYVIAMASDDLHGVASRSQEYSPEAAYIYTTSNGGESWTASTPPATVNVAGSYAAIVGGFWASDNQHVWLVGFIGNSTHGLLLRSSDAGKTWTDLSPQLVGVADTKIHTGFALDPGHIWIGGEDGTLLYSTSGGG